MFWNKYPYTDFHELNLDMILGLMKKLHAEWDEFTALNKITNAGTWDITKQYQAWTVVSDNNVGYISLKPVPAGIAITNTEYWGVIADYDIYITDLSNRISALENTVGDSSSGLVHDVTDLQNHVYRKYVFVSDSYGASVVPAIVTQLGLTSSDYVSIQRGGSSFGATYGSSDNWQTMIENETTTDNETYTDVVYIGGCNEASQAEATIIANAQSCYDYVKNRFYNAKQWYFFAGYFGGLDSDTYNLTYRVRLDRRLPSCILSTERPFIYNEVWYPLANTDNMNSADWVHPTATGAKLIASEICSCLFGGIADYKSDCLSAVNMTSSHTIDWSYMTAYRHNDKAYLSIRAMHLKLASQVMMLSTGTVITLGTIDSNIIRGGYMDSGNTYDLFMGSCLCQVGIPGGGGSRVLSGELYLSKNNELKIKLSPAWSEAPGYYIDTLQLTYFTTEISGYLN